MLILTQGQVRDIIDPESVVKAVEEAFMAYAKGNASMPPKIYLDLPRYKGDFRAMPALVGSFSGLKWVNSHPGNPAEHQLPTVMAVLILNDPRTGEPLAVMDATTITGYRTAAASVVASRHLAVPGAQTLGLVGCGAQAITHLACFQHFFNFRQILVYDMDAERVGKLLAAFPSLPLKPAHLPEVCGCQILCTLTPGRNPVIRHEWIEPGTHINAVGADAPGKQELDPSVLIQGRVFVDDREQAMHSGEINVAVTNGLYSEDMLAGSLGEVVAGLNSGRQGQEITIFDSTGLAIQDVATGWFIFEEARRRGIGLEVDFFA